MNNNHKALWDDCLRLIRANVTEQQFKTWFAPIVFESFDETNRRDEPYRIGASSKPICIRVLGAVLRWIIK